jgi:nucleoside-diphosphate-sugar epimerase
MKRNSFKGALIVPLSLLILQSLFLTLPHVNATNAYTQQILPALTPDSIVLITGAASHLGSQLAVTLYRTYNVSQLILIDDLSANDLFLPANRLSDDLLDTFSEDKPSKEDVLRSKESLASFECKRQRIFHVLQTLQDRGYFYRVDFRPVLPEYSETKTNTEAGYQNLGLPVLDMIFNKFDITHVVHMDDNVLNPKYTQVVPRKKEDNRMGMMDGLLEQLKNTKEQKGKQPHFVYSSSHEIYDHVAGEKKEDWDISFQPNHSLKGTSKLLDEVLATSYSRVYGVYSVGLRFFEVYGPWSSPETDIFQMSERALDTDMSILHPKNDSNNVFSERDYVYIDDAVDAILSAMQFSAPTLQSLVINIGTGKGFTLADIASTMEAHLPRTTVEHQVTTILEGLDTYSSGYSSYVASTKRSSNILNFRPQVTMPEGIERTLAWHHDRSYGSDGRSTFTNLGAQSCSTSDSDCLRGIPVFPCLSECARQGLCIPSVYDNAATISKAITKSCEMVMYTILLDTNATGIPSTAANLSPGGNSSVAGNTCNIAFINEASKLMAKMKQRVGIENEINYEDKLYDMVKAGLDISDSDLLKFGFWIIIPVTFSIPETPSMISNMLPKLSPSSFFSSKYALYCNPNVSIKDTSKVLSDFRLEEVNMGSSIAFMIGGSNSQSMQKEKQFCSVASYNQERIYNSIRLALKGHAFKRWTPDSSWILHSLSPDVARDLLCDLQGEINGWKVMEDNESIDFMLTLHGYWSSALVGWVGQGSGLGAEDEFGENFGILSGGGKVIVRVVSSEEIGIVLVE